MQPIVLGRVGAPHGVRGWVRVQSYARPPDSILDHARWYLDSGAGWQPWQVADSHVGDKVITVRLEGCEDRDTALTLRHGSIAVPRAELRPLAPGEWYWADLIGLQVETTDGVVLGRVEHLFETGANDVLVVRGDRERLIPWVRDQVIHGVEPEVGRLVVDWDEDF